MSTNAVVDVITQYLMTFGPLLGDIKRSSYYYHFRPNVNFKKKLEDKEFVHSLKMYLSVYIC